MGVHQVRQALRRRTVLPGEPHQEGTQGVGGHFAVHQGQTWRDAKYISFDNRWVMSLTEGIIDFVR